MSGQLGNYPVHTPWPQNITYPADLMYAGYIWSIAERAPAAFLSHNGDYVLTLAEIVNHNSSLA